MRSRAGLLAIVCCSTLAHADQSNDSALLQIRSQHAYNALFGLPGVAARTVQSREWQLSLEHANQFMGGMAGNEQLILDGETTELSFRVRQRLAPCWQGEFGIPFIQHNGGKFDRSIDSWHQFFGFPDAGRDEFNFNALTYSYTGESGQQARVDSSESGLGDIQLSIQRSLGCEVATGSMASQAIVRVGIKLPTGEVEELRGSGKVDTYIDIQSPVWSNNGRWRAGATLGLMSVGQSSRLAPQRPLVAFGALGAQFILRQRYRLLLQVDWHSPFYRSALGELNDPSVVLTAGMRYLARPNQTLDLTIGEDIAVDTAPDIVARLAWTYRPPAADM